jgi:hypothetical protein
MTDATLLPFDLSAVRRKKLTVDFCRRQPVLEWRSAAPAARGTQPAAYRWDAGSARCEPHPARDVRNGDGTRLCDRVIHEDAIDLDRLRHDPLMKVAVVRCPQSGAPLASQSTISRLENAPRKTEAARLTAALIDQAGATVKPGKQEILDIDDT